MSIDSAIIFRLLWGNETSLFVYCVCLVPNEGICNCQHFCMVNIILHPRLDKEESENIKVNTPKSSPKFWDMLRS